MAGGNGGSGSNVAGGTGGGTTNVGGNGGKSGDGAGYQASPQHGGGGGGGTSFMSGDSGGNGRVVLIYTAIVADPAYISGSSSAAATGSLSLAANKLITGSSNASASASLSLSVPTPVAVSTNSSSSTAQASLTLNANIRFGSLSSSAIANGSLSLSTTSAVGSRAAPGWLGMFVLDSSGSSVPLISGGANATATGSLSLLTPSPQTISGSSQARAIASMLLTVLRGGAALIIRDTYVTSAQFGSKTVSSDTFGDRTVYVHPESTIP